MVHSSRAFLLPGITAATAGMDGAVVSLFSTLKALLEPGQAKHHTSHV